MKVITKLDDTLLGYLNEFKDWAFSEKTQESLKTKIEWPKNQYFNEGRPEFAVSREMLSQMDADTHIGYPTDLYGVDLNYPSVASLKVAPAFLEEIRQLNISIDDKLGNFLGARFPALKAYYPANGYIAWHTNWNAPGYNIVFTYSNGGDGYWRHIDPSGSNTHKPDLEKMVHIPDQKGWHCKVGYYGTKAETDKLMWHSAYTNEPRLTMGYVVYDKAIWESMVEEIEGK